MKILGVTGPSGAGKSSLAKDIEKLNIKVIDADEVYHSLLIPPSDCLLAIRNVFGDDVFDDSGALSRQKLAAVVFNDKEKLDLLNSTVLPFVLDKIRRIISELEGEVVIVDAPTLIESGFNKECDAVISILCPYEIRLKRIMERDKITRDAAVARINAQKPDSFYINASDAVIINDGDENELYGKMLTVLNGLFPSLYSEAKT